MKRWRRFLALNGAQRRVFLWSLAVSPLAALVLHWRGLAKAQTIVSGVAGLVRSDLTPVEAARMVNAAASLAGVSCLPRSLVLWTLVRERGATLRLGIARFPHEGFAAHAWVELDGVPLNDRPDIAERYAAVEAGARGLGA